MSASTAWFLLLLAIAAEVVGTSCLKLSAGMTRLGPSLTVVLAYSLAMMLMAKAVQVIPLGLSYALWSGIGIIAIVLVGVLAYRQIPTTAQLLGIALITLGVVVVNLGGSQPPA